MFRSIWLLIGKLLGKRASFFPEPTVLKGFIKKFCADYPAPELVRSIHFCNDIPCFLLLNFFYDFEDCEASPEHQRHLERS